MQPLEPVGGGAWRHLGYRAGFSGGIQNQNENQVIHQEQLSQRPPDPVARNYLALIIRLLQVKHIAIAVTYPPLLDRRSAYLDVGQAEGPYRAVHNWLLAQGVSVIDSSDPVPRRAEYFVNAGHLNDRGAQIYSAWLGHELERVWTWHGKDQDVVHGL
jgi:hypothetical protein